MRVAIATLGCKVNQYDSAVMSNRFSDRGWQRVAFSEPADAYVVNSCTVTARADSDARRLCRKARRTSPDARVIMTGCYAQVSAPDVAALEEVDYVVGLGRLDDLLDAVNGELEERIAVSDLRKTTEVSTLGLESVHQQVQEQGLDELLLPVEKVEEALPDAPDEAVQLGAPSRQGSLPPR